MYPACRCRNHVNYLQQYFLYGEIDFYRCSQCGMVLRKPMPSIENLDKIYSELYNSSQILTGNTNQESGIRVLQQYSDFLADKFVKAGSSLLDYGCGSGFLVRSMRTKGIKSQGVERSAGARGFAKDHHGIELYASMDNILDASVDFVTMIEVIEHLTDPMAVLLEIKKKIRPGGMIFITTPNRNGLRAKLEGGNWREAQKKFHVVLFDQASLKTLLQSAEFTEVRHIRFSPVQRIGGSLLRIAVRVQQAIGFSGTVCFLARVPR